MVGVPWGRSRRIVAVVAQSLLWRSRRGVVAVLAKPSRRDHRGVAQCGHHSVTISAWPSQCGRSVGKAVGAWPSGRGRRSVAVAAWPSQRGRRSVAVAA